MSDFSRDTFKLTNVMHQFVTKETVVNPRHYVGVRMQQGVPVLDSDLNEIVDIPMHTIELLLRDVIGNGVPGKGQGFAISSIEVDNDFAIEAGVVMLGGWQVFNPQRIQYSQQPRFLDSNGVSTGTDLTTPSGDRTDIVYLDVWEQETSANSGDYSDARLVNATIGVETALRQERRWTVWVAENETDFDNLILNESGHKYLPLAKLFRSDSIRIQPYMSMDLRRMGLTLADAVKAPMYIKRGSEELGPERFSSMLSELRSVLRIWQENILFPVGGTSGLNVFIIYQNAFNDLYYFTSAAEVNSDTLNLDNSDGLKVMQSLVNAQKRMITALRSISSGDPDIYKLYESYINGDSGKNIGGIQPAINDQDFLTTVKEQEALIEYLSLSTGNLPEGDVLVSMKEVAPSTAIDPLTGFTITYRVESDLQIPTTAEQFDLEAYGSDVRWAITLDKSSVTLAPGQSEEVVMSVDPDDSLANGEIAQVNLIARAHRRSSIKSVLPAETYTIGSPPPGATFFYYSGNVPLSGGVLIISRAQIENKTYDVNFTLVNSSGGGVTGQEHTFRLNHELQWPPTSPAGVNPGAWLPPSPQEQSNLVVSDADQPVTITIFAPSLSGVSEDINFTLIITATLTHSDGAPVMAGKTKLIELPIVVGMTP